MNDLKIFSNEDFGEVRTVLVDNEPMFCLADVCKALEISNPSKVAQRLDEDERTKLELGRAGDTNFVADVDLQNEQMDRITADSYGEHTGKLTVTGMNLLNDATKDNTNILFADEGSSREMYPPQHSLR